ncbi:MAG: glycosyltransferase family 2 protein [Geminicoccaceae bacterium]
MTDEEPSGNSRPLVTIGIPVFNGAAYLEDAIRSAMNQTFTDLEIVVSDNASTDSTPAILERLAGEDRRIRVFRNETNLGAAPNYNRCHEEARGVYFKWLAHDDRMKPGYLAAMIETLEAHPEAVLVNAITDYIDDNGDRFATYDSELRKASGDDPVARFAEMVLRSHSCVDFFGVCRMEALDGSLLHGPFHGADRAFLAQMALRGRLLQVREPLIEMREHSQRYTRIQQKVRDREGWHDARRKRGWNLPTWRLYGEYVKMVACERLTSGQRLRAFGILLRWWVSNWNAVRAGVDIVSLVFPGLPALAERVKIRIFGLAPGHYDLGDRDPVSGKDAVTGSR